MLFRRGNKPAEQSRSNRWGGQGEWGHPSAPASCPSEPPAHLVPRGKVGPCCGAVLFTLFVALTKDSRSAAKGQPCLLTSSRRHFGISGTDDAESLTDALPLPFCAPQLMPRSQGAAARDIAFELAASTSQ